MPTTPHVRACVIAFANNLRARRFPDMDKPDNPLGKIGDFFSGLAGDSEPEAKPAEEPPAEAPPAEEPTKE